MTMRSPNAIFLHQEGDLYNTPILKALRARNDSLLSFEKLEGLTGTFLWKRRWRIYIVYITYLNCGNEI